MVQLNSLGTAKGVYGQLQFFRYTKGTNDFISIHSTTKLKPYSRCTLITVENPSFSSATRAIWQRSRAVSEENSLHVHRHTFFDHSTRKCLCLGFREGLLIVLLIEAILWRVRLRAVFVIFSSPASLTILLLVVQGIQRTFIFNRFTSRNDNYLNHRDQTKVSFLKDFSKILSLSRIFVTTWRCILSEIDLIVLPLAIYFIIRTFSPSARSFSRFTVYCSTNFETNNLGHLFYRRTPGF